MIRIETKYMNLFSMERIWFPDEGLDMDSVKSKCDIVRLLRASNKEIKSDHVLTDTCYTLISDLNLDEQELLSRIKKNVRYEIKRASKEDINVSFYESIELKNNSWILDEFFKTYQSFCKISGRPELIKDYSKDKITSYVKNDCITVSIAEYTDGRVFHMYVHDSLNTCLVYSASDFRNENVDKNLAGRANKLLHYKDLLYFQSLGVSKYDWGNISDKDEPNGIDVFKMSFGGEIKAIYNIYIGNSFLGRQLLKLKKYSNK